MKAWLIATCACLALALPAQAKPPKPKSPSSAEAHTMQGIYQFKVKDIDGAEKSLGDYKGKVLLLVNVASKCGNTPQYKGLETLYERFKDRGFMILGFPADNFGHQEPGSDKEIKQFCTEHYGVSFDMFSKVSVKGGDKAPLYKYLTEQSDFKGEIGWNFGKYLVGKNGLTKGYFEPGTQPDNKDLSKAIEAALSETASK